MKTWETFRQERFDSGVELGMKKGREEGIEEGREEGIEIGTQRAIREIRERLARREASGAASAMTGWTKSCPR